MVTEGVKLRPQLPTEGELGLHARKKDTLASTPQLKKQEMKKMLQKQDHRQLVLNYPKK